MLWHEVISESFTHCKQPGAVRDKASGRGETSEAENFDRTERFFFVVFMKLSISVFVAFHSGQTKREEERERNQCNDFSETLPVMFHT